MVGGTPALSGKNLYPEGGEASEAEPRRKEVLIFGHWGFDTLELMDEISRCLEDKGTPDVSVRLLKDIAFVEPGFLGRKGDHSTFWGTPYENWYRYSPESLTDFRDGDTVPLAVVALPEMRSYEEVGAGDAFTPFERIEALCERYEVPLLRFDFVGEDSGKLVQGLGELLPSQES